MFRSRLFPFALVSCLGVVLAASMARGEDVLDEAPEDGAEVMARGPVHEAFATPSEARPGPSPVVAKEPPEAVEEMPPEEKPEGDNVLWVPGYWAYDEEASDFLWISGFWRVAPPGREWAPGTWQKVSDGWQWSPGYWVEAGTGEVEYLPGPARSHRGRAVHPRPHRHHAPPRGPDVSRAQNEPCDDAPSHHPDVPATCHRRYGAAPRHPAGASDGWRRPPGAWAGSRRPGPVLSPRRRCVTRGKAQRQPRSLLPGPALLHERAGPFSHQPPRPAVSTASRSSSCAPCHASTVPIGSQKFVGTTCTVPRRASALT